MWTYGLHLTRLKIRAEAKLRRIILPRNYFTRIVAVKTLRHSFWWLFSLDTATGLWGYLPVSLHPAWWDRPRKFKPGWGSYGTHIHKGPNTLA